VILTAFAFLLSGGAALVYQVVWPAPGKILPNTDLFPRDEFARPWRDRP